jgi:hypothetical protein
MLLWAVRTALAGIVILTGLVGAVILAARRRNR